MAKPGIACHATTDATFAEHTVRLAPGSVVALFTDGLVERRGEELDTGFARVVDVMGGADRDLDRWADALLADVLGTDEPADDVAVLLVRAGRRAGALRLELPRHASELAQLRVALDGWLSGAGASAEELEELTVAINEVAANAIEHAGSDAEDRFEVRGEVEGGEVTVTVIDRAPWRERGQVSDTRGRGLLLARAFTDDLTIETDATATSVRLRRRLAGAGA